MLFKEHIYHNALLGWFHTVASRITFVLFSKPTVLKLLKLAKLLLYVCFY